MKLALFALLFIATSTLTVKVDIKNELKAIAEARLVEQEEADETMTALTFEPVKGTYRKMTIPRKFISKITGLLPRIVKFPAPEGTYTKMFASASECPETGFVTGDILDTANHVDEKGFSAGKLTYIIGCSDTNTLDFIITTGTIKGSYTKVTKIERDVKTCTVSKWTGIESCETNDVLTKEDREITPELIKSVVTYLNNMYLKHILSRLN